MIKFLIILVSLSSFSALGQQPVMYVAARSGLNIRETQDLNAKALYRIPYGMRVTLLPMEENTLPVTSEGMAGYWRKVSYGNKTGYIIDCYLLPMPPPSGSIKNMKEFLAQLSAPAGPGLSVRTGDEETGYTVTKQLYKNAAEWHELTGYEYNSATYFIPGLTIQQGFLLLRLIGEFKDAVGEKDEFPQKDRTFTKD